MASKMMMKCVFLTLVTPCLRKSSVNADETLFCCAFLTRFQTAIKEHQYKIINMHRWLVFMQILDFVCSYFIPQLCFNMC